MWKRDKVKERAKVKERGEVRKRWCKKRNKVKKLYLLIFNIFIQRPRTESYILGY